MEAGLWHSPHVHSGMTVIFLSPFAWTCRELAAEDFGAQQKTVLLRFHGIPGPTGPTSAWPSSGPRGPVTLPPVTRSPAAHTTPPADATRGVSSVFQQ